MASTALGIAGGAPGHGRNPKVQFILSGFAQENDVRVFTFEDTSCDGGGVQYSVRADLGLARRYGIATQELPLLCRSMLERCDRSQELGTISFGEEAMSSHARACQCLQRDAQLKKSKRRPPRPGFQADESARHAAMFVSPERVPTEKKAAIA